MGEPVVPTSAAPSSADASALPAEGSLERSRRPVAIVISYCCGPGEGSESGAGWAWTRAASEVADVILLTHSATVLRPRIEAAIAELQLPISVHWVDLPPWVISLFKGKLLGAVKYCLWQAMAARVIRRYEHEQSIDAVHHVSWASDSLPSALAASRAPVRVWGPVGGVTRTAWGLYRYLTPRGRAGEIARDVMTATLRATSGRWMARRATLVVALNHDVEAHWRSGPTPVVVESNMAFEESELLTAALQAPWSDTHRHRVALFVGRLVPLKGLLLAIESLRYVSGWKLVVLGEGPDRTRGEALAARLGIGDRLQFRGGVPRAQVLEAFHAADALLFPSFHDSNSWAVGEATSMGCPVVCLDAGGPALQAGRNAHVVPIAPASTLPERIGACLEALAGRGEPDDSWRADRIPGVLRAWYSGCGARTSPPGAQTAPR